MQPKRDFFEGQNRTEGKTQRTTSQPRQRGVEAEKRYVRKGKKKGKEKRKGKKERKKGERQFW